jgi:hypothetical protein
MSAKCMRVIAAATLFLTSGALLCIAESSQALAADAPAGVQRAASTQTGRPQNTAPQQARPQAQALTQSEFKPARAISAADVLFPLQTTADGIVVFSVSLNVQGEVKKVTVLQDVPPFTEAAAQSLRGWKFAAASQNGSAADSEMLVAFVFRHAVGVTPPPPFAPIFPTEEFGSQPRSSFIAPGILSVQYAKYPASTIAAGAEVVQVSVDANGSTDDIKVLRDMEGGFRSPALNAASGWEFQAPLQDGKPVPSRVAIAFVFSSRSLNPF